MAFFIATGIISNDIVRRETRNGVVVTFRLETGAPRGGKLWIDVECWGHLAGTIAHHGETGRNVSVSGRLTQKTWRDKTSGEARSRYVVSAIDVDLHAHRTEGRRLEVSNSLLLRGVVDQVLPSRNVASGTVARLKVAVGRAGAKTGRLRIVVEHWSPAGVTPEPVNERAEIAAIGGIAYSPGGAASPHALALSARSLSCHS